MIIRLFEKFLDKKSNKSKSGMVPITKKQITLHLCKKNKIHVSLLTALKKQKNTVLSEEYVLFHGCFEYSLHTDFKNRALVGSRKWFSVDPIYASEYAFFGDEIDRGRHLLWKCKIKRPLQSIEGEQTELIDYSPWGGLFPNMFPNSFYSYAEKIFGNDQSSGYLDKGNNDYYKEVLISKHQDVIDIIDVYVLPEDKKQAKEFASELIK